MYDVIIVGAGPGGASAAYFLSQAGKSVLVLEKNTLPRYKACGGGVSLRMLAKYFPFSFDPVINARVGAIIYSLGDDEVTVRLPEGVLGMVMRAHFDKYILEHATADLVENAQVTRVAELEDRVTVETKDGRHFEGSYLIGADGATSMVAKLLKLRRRHKPVPAIEAEAQVSPEILARYRTKPVFIFSAIRRGYLWIFPKHDHLSVGVAEFHPKPGHMQAKLNQVMKAHGILMENADIHGHMIPLYSGPARIARRRSVLVGDAAGLVDPLSGEGIRLAIKSAFLASQSILKGKISTYSWDVFWKIGLSQSLAFFLRYCFYYLTELCFIFGVYNPIASQAFMRLLSDEIGYGRLLLILFGSLPLFFATEISSGLIELFGRPGTAARLRARVYGKWSRVEG